MGRRWSKREEAILIVKYEHASWTELKQLLPRRGKKSIEDKAKALSLTRPMFSTRKGLYFKFARCPVHGRILKDDILWVGKRLNIAMCPKEYCKRRLTIKPKSSKLRMKYRNV